MDREEEDFVLPGDVGEKPEADVLDQARSVDDQSERVTQRANDEIPEADWLEQSVVEPLDEDEDR